LVRIDQQAAATASATSAGVQAISILAWCASGFDLIGSRLEHDPEKWEPVFGKDHAQTKC
jgi:hypothetical protein